MRFTEQIANIVYDILIEFGQANKYERSSFIFHHCNEAKPMCEEWRINEIAAGAKYRSKTNTVDVYYEFETKENKKKIDKLNIELSHLPYIKVLQDFGYIKQNYGYFKPGQFSNHWVTLFENGTLQMYQYEIEGDEFSDSKIYDTSVIKVTPEDLYQLIQILVINQIEE